MDIGFVGLGAMGLPMAKNVIKGGHRLFTAIHRRAAPGSELKALGAAICSTPQEVAQRSEIVITIVPADREVEEVVFGAAGVLQGLSKGKTLIEMTTAAPATMRRVATALSQKGVDVLDAPVSGGTVKAATGELTIIVGGNPSVLQRCKPVLQTMGTSIYHVGDVGAGKVVKMVNQLMAAVHMAVLGEAFALGVKCGAEPKTMAEVIRNSSGYSRMVDARLPDFVMKDAFQPGFTLDLMKKDVNLALEAARETNVPLYLGGIVGQVFTSASAAGAGAKDFSFVARYLADLAGVKLASGAPA